MDYRPLLQLVRNGRQDYRFNRHAAVPVYHEDDYGRTNEIPNPSVVPISHGNIGFHYNIVTCDIFWNYCFEHSLLIKTLTFRIMPKDKSFASLRMQQETVQEDLLVCRTARYRLSFPWWIRIWIMLFRWMFQLLPICFCTSVCSIPTSHISQSISSTWCSCSSSNSSSPHWTNIIGNNCKYIINIFI